MCVEETPELQKTATQGMKFVVVGISGIGVNFTILTLALYVFHLIDAIAIAIAILSSMTSNYMLNRIWTFKSEGNIKTEYVRYISLNLLGSLIQYSVTLGLTRYFESLGFVGIDLIIFAIPQIYIASVFGIGCGFVSNFIFAKFLVFKK